jgi:hypothetical protein
MSVHAANAELVSSAVGCSATLAANEKSRALAPLR